jgi:hypothetical protein
MFRVGFTSISISHPRQNEAPMEVKLSLLSDYASVSLEGKLSILGIFEQINPPILPLAIPLMYLVTMFEASPVESNSTKQLRIVLAGADGAEVLTIEQTLTVPPAPIPGKPVLMNHVVALAGVEFRKSGDYAFHILVGGEEKKRAPLFVNQPTGDPK